MIPTRDRADILHRAILTVQRQTFADWELLVVDDGSTVPVVLAGPAAQDPRISLIRHPVSLGVSEARNTGIAAARAPWIAFLDDDDFWWPGKLELQLAAAAEHGSSFVFTGRITVDRRGRVTDDRGPAPTGDLTATLMARNLVGEPSSVLVRREVLAATEGFCPELSVVADWDMWLQLSRHAKPLGLPQRTTAIVAHSGSMQLTQAHEIPRELAVMRRRHPDASFAELWIAGIRWQRSPSIGNLINYCRLAWPSRRELTPRRILQRVRRAIAARRQQGPSWVREQMAPSEPWRNAAPGPGQQR